MDLWIARGFAGVALSCATLVMAANADEAGDVRAVLAGAPEAVASWAAVDVTSLREGWKDSGLTVEAGDHVTVLGHGPLRLADGQTLAPRQFLWLRFGGEGPVVRVADAEDTFPAPRGGTIEIAIKPGGIQWDDPAGSFPGGFESLSDAPIDVGATVMVWRGDPASGLASLARDPADAFVRAAAAFASAPHLPAGFEYLWFAGRNRFFAAWSDGSRTGVRALPNDFGGIIKKPVDIPLMEDTEFSFEWIYDHVPGLGPETEAQFHDYISIALEFDNGQDLTWMRSAHLEAPHSFHCPLPWWDARETHIVLEDSDAPLHEWRTHTRRVADDYASAVGGPMPRRITGVWFINVGAFGGHDGDARFANAAITSAGERTEVFVAD